MSARSEAYAKVDYEIKTTLEEVLAER